MDESSIRACVKDFAPQLRLEGQVSEIAREVLSDRKAANG
jgi:hypothetical protein